MAQQYYSDNSDIIEFFNNDKMHGKLKNIQRGELSFDPDYLEDKFTAKLQDIRYIRARRKRYLVETVDHVKRYGILDHGKLPGWVKIIGINDSIEVPIADLDHIENLDDNFWKRLDGSASLGFSYSRSSNIGRINESHNMTYSTRNWTFLTSGDLMYTIDKDFKGVEKADLALQAYFEYLRKWFAVSSIQFQRSTELGLNARFQLAEATGPIIIKTRQQDLRTATGISIQKEFSADSSNQGNGLSAEIPLFVNYYLYNLGTPELKLQVANYIFFGFTGRWRADQNITLYWKPVTHLNFNIQFYFDFDSKPPDTQAGKVDLGTVFSIGYSW